LWAGAHQFSKVPGGCEDAYFHGQAALGVADGVGSLAQYRNHGIDCAAYAADLMRCASNSFIIAEHEQQRQRHSGSPSARAAAAIAAAEDQARGFGASTIAVLHLAGSSVGAANLGDSGFMILRPRAEGFCVAARSKEQSHRFNLPYQLMRLPQVLWTRFPQDRRPDTVKDCDLYSIPVQEGDLILLFSDGFSDNLHDAEVLEIVERIAKGEPRVHPDVLARQLSQAALERSLDVGADTPFAQAARRAGRTHFGGKEDDITVVTAWVMASGSD